MMKLRQFLKLLTGSLLAGAICSDLRGQELLVTNVSRFEIPFEIDMPAGSTPQGFAVLYSSIDHGATWEKLQTVPAAQQSFQFAAPRDGTYAFAVRMTDAAGRLQSGIVGSRPELQVTVDTTAPDLRLELFEVSPGQVVLNWQTTDSGAVAETLVLEYTDGQDGRWIPITVNAAPTGQTALRVTAGSVVAVRGFLSDAAGNEGSQTTQLVLKPVSTSSTVVPPPGSSGPGYKHQAAIGPSPFSSTGGAGSSFSQPSTGHLSGGDRIPMPPAALPSSNTPGRPLQIPEVPASHSAAPAGLQRQTGLEIPQQSGPLTQPLMPSTPSLTNSSAFIGSPAVASSPGPGIAPFAPGAPLTPGREPTLVSSQVFDLVYQVEDVGPSGVGAVDVYITENGGQQWFRYGQDPDLQSPFQVDVRGEGTYGFAVRVRNGLGFADPPPQPGEMPTIIVQVDQTAPTVNFAVPVVQADGRGTVNFQWKVTERLPATAPVRLEYSTAATGPWTPAFDWQADTGGYNWPVSPGLPGALYFRLLARDAAGNVGSAQTLQPVLIDLKRPTVRGLRVQAVSNSRTSGGY